MLQVLSNRFEHHARTVTLLTLVSRVAGLARDAALSRVFGAGVIMDAFSFAFMAPNLFRRLFGEGALTAAFLPVYSRLDREDPVNARRLASLTLALLTMALGVIVLLAEAVLYVVSHVAGHENLAVWLMMVMLPYMPMVCAVAVLGAMLQVHGRFGPTAAAPVVLNVLIVIGAVGGRALLDKSGTTVVTEGTLAGVDSGVINIGLVAVMVILAGIIQVLWSLFALRDRAWWDRQWRSARPALRQVLTQAGPMIVGLGVLQLNTLLDGLIASYPTVIGPTIFGIEYPLQEGAMASVTFAQRLYQFPLGVFGIAVATAIFPLLARLGEDEDGFTDALRRGLRLVVFIGLPASAGLMIVREPLVAVILQGGDFTAEDTQRVAFVLLGYAPAVWAYSMIHVITRAFYAKGNSLTPMKVGVSVVALNLALNLTLIWFLREAGLAWSTSICAFVQVIALMILLRGDVMNANVVMSWFKTIALAAVMVVALLLLRPIMAEDEPTWMQSLMELFALVASGLAVVFLGSKLLHMDELRWALGARGVPE